MRKIILIFLLLAGFASADEYVNGYFRSNGKYVQPHFKSNKNHTKQDNFSTYGNINPYTGKKGTKKYNNQNSYNYGGYGSRKYKGVLQ